MSNSYLNKILFGVSKDQVTVKYIQSLLPYMLTNEKIRELGQLQSNCEVENVGVVPEQSSLIDLQSTQEVFTNPTLSTHSGMVSPSLPASKNFPRQGRYTNSLFWEIYNIQHPEGAFMDADIEQSSPVLSRTPCPELFKIGKPRANVEIDLRIKIASEIKKTPKRLKDTNSKLTIEQSQSLLGSLLVSKEDKLDFCIAYSVYYNKTILDVYEKTYRIFSPTTEIDLSDPDDIIILYASKPNNAIIYESEKNISSQLIDNITKTKVLGPLKSMSNYKTNELVEIVAKMNLPKTSIQPTELPHFVMPKAVSPTCAVGRSLENHPIAALSLRNCPKPKKEELYNSIRVAIHIDTNFISEFTWNQQHSSYETPQLHPPNSFE